MRLLWTHDNPFCVQGADFTFLNRSDRAPVVTMGVIAITALLWGSALGMTWEPRDPILWIVPSIFWLIYLGYRKWRPERVKISEILLYSGLWLLFPMYAAQLTYLANTWEFPLRDAELLASDAMLGFFWNDWARLMTATPVLSWVTYGLYYSYYILPYCVMLTLAGLGVWGRNANFFMAAAVALLLTALLSGLLPAFGPITSLGLPSPWVEIVLNLHAGQWMDQPYVGIVTFPSYHTAMAVLAAAALRGLPGFRWVFGIWCCAIIMTVPNWGFHYITDVIGGLVVALIAQTVVGWRLAPSEQTGPVDPVNHVGNSASVENG